MIIFVDGRNGIGAHLNLHRVSTPQFLAVLAVKGNGSLCSSVIWNVATQHDVIWEDHGSKGQDMRTNGCQKNALMKQKKVRMREICREHVEPKQRTMVPTYRNSGVDHRGASSQRVSR